MSLTYKRISSGEVDPDLHQVALEAARDAARILNLPVPRIQWIKRYLGELAGGWIDPRWPDMVHVAKDFAEQMGSAQTRALIFHEVRHIWQIKNFRFYGPGENARAEDDCEAFSFRNTHTLIGEKDYRRRYIDYYA